MTGPTRATVAGRAFRDLQNLAKRHGRDTGELLTIYALEGFPARLSTSPRAAGFVLKGGVLLAAYDARRPTRDIDLLATALPNDVDTTLDVVREIALIEADDGLAFDVAGATAESIRDEDEYTGVRISIIVRLATAVLPLHIDVNVGDPMWPAPALIELPRLLGGSISITGYPLAMVHAEKIVTAIQRGIANTRWRDFADIHTLSNRHPVEGSDLQIALKTVAGARQAQLVPLAERLHGYPELAQGRWAAWRRKYRLDEAVPTSFQDVLTEIATFADPALRGQVTGLRWEPHHRIWHGAAENTPAR